MGRRFKKQECVISDKCGSCRLVLWEKLVECVKVGKSYRVNDAAVKMYNGRKYLSSTDDCIVEEINDIGNVADV